MRVSEIMRNGSRNGDAYKQEIRIVVSIRCNNGIYVRSSADDLQLIIRKMNKTAVRFGSCKSQDVRMTLTNCGVVNTRWPGYFFLRTSASMDVRYAIIPLQLGMTCLSVSAASARFPSAWKRAATPLSMQARTADLSPSAATRRSHVAAVPSSK